MGKVLVKAQKKVLVKASPQLQYDMQGNASFVFGHGGGGKGGGSTKREKILGGIGGAVGVLGALTGSHKNAGSLANALYAGGIRGKGLGRGLGNFFTSRNRQSRADLEEKEKQEYADMRAREQAADRDPNRHIQTLGDVKFGRTGRRNAMNNWATEAGRRDAKTNLEQERANLRNPELTQLAHEKALHNALINQRVKEQIKPGTAEAMQTVNPTNAITQTLPLNGNMSPRVDDLNNVDPKYKDHNEEGLEAKPTITPQQERDMNEELFNNPVRGNVNQAQPWRIKQPPSDAFDPLGPAGGAANGAQ